MLKKWSPIIILAATLVWGMGITATAWADGPYRGKVIDAETKAPIEGAVVVAIWTEKVVETLPFQGRELKKTTRRFAEAKEALTDKNGEFEIPGYVKGKVGKDYMGAQPPHFHIFKPGYGKYPWHQVSPKENVKYHFWRFTVVELQKLTTREERLRMYRELSLYTYVPNHKIPNWLHLERMERAYLYP